MKDAVLDGLVAVSVYETKPDHFLSMCCNAIKQVQKTHQVYEPEIDMVRVVQILRLNVNELYNHNMNVVDLSDKLRNCCQFYLYMCK